jgi:hypothetical protein
MYYETCKDILIYIFHLADIVTTLSYTNINPRPHQDEGSGIAEKLPLFL